ncbi:MAG: hypothetical protein ACRD01_08585 [Terriglobales bacterium]
MTSAADVLTVTQAGQATGTAATGAPIAGAVVTLKDATGASATATTASDGTFTIATGGLTPPFLLAVTPTSGTPLYSVSADANTSTTINIDPLTDVTIRSWYAAQGVTVGTAFSDPVTAPAPTPTQLAPIVTFVQNQVQLWLTNNGVSTTNFNLITTPFTANGSGVDKVLDETTVTNGQSSATLAITDGTTTQTTSLTYTASSNSVSAATTTTSGTGASQVTSTNTSTTAVPVSTPQATALAAINAQCAALTTVFAAKGANLADTDIEAFFASDLMFDGLNKDQFAAQIATFARGVTASLTATQLESLDTTAGKASAHVIFALGASQLSVDMNFEEVAGTWLLSGDGRVAGVDIGTEYMFSQEGAQTHTELDLNADVKSPVGLVTGVTVSGSIFGGGTALNQVAQQQQTFAPTPGGSLVVTLDNFNNGVAVSTLSAGTPITFNLVTTSGPVSYTLDTNAVTNDPVVLTGITSSSLSTLTMGGSNTFNWTLPKTFPIASLSLKSEAFNGDPSNPATTDCRQAIQLDSITATSGTITVPATCSGTIVQVQIWVSAQGVNGEDSEAEALFGTDFNAGTPSGAEMPVGVSVSQPTLATGLHTVDVRDLNGNSNNGAATVGRSLAGRRRP